MAGIFDDSQLSDPRTQGILQAAFALMQASGASKLPVGMGEALGKAGQAGITGYEQAKAMQFAEQKKKLELAAAQQELEQRQALAGMDMNDPEALRRYGIATKKPEYITHAERIEKDRRQQEELKAMQSQVKVIAPDPQEIEQAADQGTPAPAPVQVKTGGIFGDLAKSEYKDIAAEAARRQEEVDAAKTRDPEKIRAERERLLGMVEKRMEREDAGSIKSVKDPSSSTGWSYKNLRTNKIVSKDAPPPSHANSQGSSVIPAEHSSLTGDAYLKTLPTAMAAIVKGVAEGRIDPAKAASMRYGNREAMMERVLQYDPKYNQQRVNVYRDFTSGKTANNVTAINMVIHHMGTAHDLTQALSNGNVQTANALTNRLRVELGDEKINNANIAVQAVANEMMRVFRQVGASTTEIKEWEEKINAAKGSPKQLSGAIKTLSKLLQGRIEAVDEQWMRGMDTDKGYPNLLSPKSKAALDKINGKAAATAGGPYSDAEKERRYQEWKKKQAGGQ